MGLSCNCCSRTPEPIPDKVNKNPFSIGVLREESQKIVPKASRRKSVSYLRKSCSARRGSVDLIMPKRKNADHKRKLNKADIMRIQFFDTTQSEKGQFKITSTNNKALNDKDLILKCFKKKNYLSTLNEKSLLEIVKEMSSCEIKQNEIIFKQGDIGNHFFFVKTGIIHLIVNNEVVKEVKAGESFGELALLYKTTRSCSAVADTDCFLYFLERKTFNKIMDFLLKKNSDKIEQFVEKNSFFKNFEITEKNYINSLLIPEIFERNTQIFLQNQQADCVFFIEKGEVHLYHDKKLICKKKESEYFGEDSILNNGIRNYLAIANCNCQFYVLPLSAFKEMDKENFFKNMVNIFLKNAFSSSKIFQEVDLNILQNEIFNLFEIVNIDEDDIAFEKNTDVTDFLTIVLSGNLIFANDKKKNIICKNNNILFEKNIYNNTPNIINDDLIGYPYCVLAKADKKKVVEVLGCELSELKNVTKIINNLKQVKLFNTLNYDNLIKIQKEMKIEKYITNDILIKEGEEGNKFFIVESGSVDIYIHDKYIRTIKESDFLGERSLIIQGKRSATAIAKTDVTVYTIEKEPFLKIIEGNMTQYLTKRLNLQEDKLELSDLFYEKTLGKGSFGQVCLVYAKKNNFLYAIKSISKRGVIQSKTQKNLEMEKNILLQIDHQFIVKLVKTLQDKRYVYFLMEYVQGKELFDIIRIIGNLTKTQTQFYSGILFEIISYLHKNKIIYRDLKPENIIVEGNGYIKLIDFGIAKQIENKTSSMIGTPHYMAPEVFSGEGYSFGVDYWSVGVCMFEFMCGYVPFGNETTEPMQIYSEIMATENLTFPSHIKDKNFKSLVKGILNKNPLERISNLEKIKIHPWFIGFDWDMLLNMSMKPVYIPDKVVDTDNKNENAGMLYTEYNYRNFYDKYKNTDVDVDFFQNF